MPSVPPWVAQLCAEIGAAENADTARSAMWHAFHKITALPPHEHAVASDMISAAMRGRKD
jgi:hypothetical protein